MISVAWCCLSTIKRGAIPLRMAEEIAMLVVMPRNTCTCMKSLNINKQLHTNCKLSRKIFAERQQLASRGLRAAPLLNISSILNLLESSKGTCKLTKWCKRMMVTN
jgi:hypothetical protein